MTLIVVVCSVHPSLGANGNQCSRLLSVPLKSTPPNEKDPSLPAQPINAAVATVTGSK